MGWGEHDSAVYVYDKYDIWKVDPSLTGKPENVLEGNGRKLKISNRYIKTDLEERFLSSGKELLLRTFNDQTKKSGLSFLVLGVPNIKVRHEQANYWYGSLLKAKDPACFLYTKESFNESPDIYFNEGLKKERKLSGINSQQKDYNWGTAELYKWKTFPGKQSEGILYKPEDFDPAKKYPLILYFYEKLSDGLYAYHSPSPSASRLNISFFVSRGYVVFAPDITYTIGHPAKSAYDYIVSAAKDLAKHKWVDSDNIGIQGQSWGGIQVAQLITMTDMFKAAWAGAPVANMTSAYGGIRWESGLNRQFQYEKTQSRIGATLWEKPNLYIENSPLFHLKNVTTPLVIMHNDNDGAVPWYQGIELFTAMRRLGKKVWMFNYNGEGHGLTDRKDKLDYQIRMQQF